MASEPRILASKRLREAWPPVSEDDVQLPSGARKTWIRMHLGTSAAILAVTKEKEIVLTREYRHGLGRIAFSLPGGTARGGESPDACARGEVIEATGYEAWRVLELFGGNRLTAYLAGMLHLFFTWEFRPTDGRPAADERRPGERMTA